jgi:predicted ATP-dependent Lon-type protease
MHELNKKINQIFSGKVVRKDLVRIAYSGPKLPLIPGETCHLFRIKVATHSG